MKRGRSRHGPLVYTWGTSLVACAIVAAVAVFLDLAAVLDPLWLVPTWPRAVLPYLVAFAVYLTWEVTNE